METMEARKLAEKEFHDKLRSSSEDEGVHATRWTPELEKTISTNPLWANMKYYAVERASRQMVLDWYAANCRGKRALDYCCGNGEDSIEMVRAGAREIQAIDISDASVENCRAFAEREGMGDKITFSVADAEKTGFADNSFDIISEYGSLHHLELDLAYAELARVLKPDGKIVCTEALAHNPIIHLYRKLTPKLRTVWEVQHILKKPKIDLARKYFDSVELHFFHLTTLFAVPFRKTPLFRPLLAFLEGVDRLLLKLPWIKWQAWQVVIVLSKPKKLSN